MRTSLRWTLVPLVVGMSGVANAQQQFSWENYCTVGALQACASVELQLTPTNANTTQFSVRLRNLEGTYGSTPWGMFNVGFLGLSTGPLDWSQPGTWFPTTYSGTGTIATTLDPTNPYCVQFGCPNPGWNQEEWAAGASDGRGFAYWTIGFPPISAVVGCDLVPQDAGPSPAFGYFQTCGDGWVNVSFTQPGTWIFDDESSVFMNGWIADGSRISCTFDVDCVVATPEPATLLLVGTGLVGLAAHRRRRSTRPSPANRTTQP